MTVRRKAFGIVLGMAACLSVAAASGPAQTIAVLDLDSAVQGTVRGQQLVADFDRKRRAADAQLQDLWDRYQALAKELMSKRFALKESVVRQKEIELAALENDLVNERRRLQGQLKIEQERLFGPERERIFEAARELGREHNLSLIVAKGTPGVVYTPETFDITEQVVQRANRM